MAAPRDEFTLRVEFTTVDGEPMCFVDGEPARQADLQQAALDWAILWRVPVRGHLWRKLIVWSKFLAHSLWAAFWGRR